MDPLLLQKQLRDNTADLQEYFKDIQSWGDEMKRKEEAIKSSPVEGEKQKEVPLPRSKMPRKEKETSVSEATTSDTSKPKVPKDYSYWQNFDAEAECEKLDNNHVKDTDSDLTDEFDEAAMELSLKEKEKGNKFVQAARWDDAIKCYTKAIDIYQYDPTFYANRALCHLKLKNYKNAEADCTIALQIDCKYVKALHRRALAREAMKQFPEAKADLERVLKLEPENKESQKLLDKIEKIIKGKTAPSQATSQAPATPARVAPAEAGTSQRPVSMFSALRQIPTAAAGVLQAADEAIGQAFNEYVVEHKRVEKIENIAKLNASLQWPAGDAVTVVQHETFIKPIKDRSRKSLKRIHVQESTLQPLLSNTPTEKANK